MGGSSPNSDSFFFVGNCVFFVFVCVFKKITNWVGGGGVCEWVLANPSFSRIFLFFLT